MSTNFPYGYIPNVPTANEHETMRIIGANSNQFVRK